MEGQRELGRVGKCEALGLVNNLPQSAKIWVLTSNISSDIDQALRVSYTIPMRLPFHRNKNFTGRDGELAEIHEALHNPDALLSDHRIVVLHGLGGIGKDRKSTRLNSSH